MRSKLWLTLLLAVGPMLGLAQDIPEEGVCKQVSITEPEVTVSSGGIDPSTLTPDICKDFCAKLNYAYAAADEGAYCWCTDDISTMTDAVDQCNAVCMDGRPCGGTEPGIMTVWLTSLYAGEINFTMNADALTFNIGETPNVTVWATGPWRLDWGDGAGPILNGTEHSFAIAGDFLVTAFLDKLPHVMDGIRVRVLEAPNATIVCPPVVEVGIEADCEFLTSSLGPNITLFTEFTHPGYPPLSYNLPSDIVSIYGSVVGLNSPGTAYTIEAHYGVTLEDGVARSGEVARVIVTVSTVGWIGIYAVSPFCDLGQYCWETQTCGASCLLDSSLLSCTSHMCVNGPRCEESPCVANTSAPVANKYQYRPLVYFYVDVANTPFTYLVDKDSPPVYDGETFAFGCLQSADCASGVATVASRPLQPSEKQEVKLYDGANSLSATVNANMTMKYLVSVVVREHPQTNANYTVTCLSASSIPTADVGPTFTADSEQYSLTGAFNLSFMLTGEAGSWSNATEVICQQQILTPTLPTEIWVALFEPMVLPVTFTQGAPMFSSLDWGQNISYVYTANASTYVWEVPILYQMTGDFILSGNASNLIGWVNYTSLIHVIPPVTHTWNATGLCPCFAIALGFNVTISFPSAPFPPWTANLTITDEMGTVLLPETFLDFATIDLNGVAQALTQDFHLVSLTPGNHTLTFFMYNEVSNTTFTTLVLLEEGLTNISSIMAWDFDGTLTPGFGIGGSSFLSNETIIFTPTSLTGSAYKWRLTLLPSGEIAYETTLGNETLQYMYTEDGEYQVMVSGYNPVEGWVDSEPINITILTEIQGFDLTDDGNVLDPNDTKIVTASFIVLPPLSCVMLDFGDNTTRVTYGYQSMCHDRYPNATYKDVLTNPIDIPHVYVNEGVFRVRGIAWDVRVTLTMELEVVIADVPCSMPVVNVTDKVQFPQSSPKVWRSMAFQRSTTASINCTRTVPVTRWWTVTKVDKWTGDPLQDVVVEHIIPSWNYSQVDIPGLFLELGVYKLTYYLTLECSKIFPLTRSDFTHVEIIPSPLQAVIIKGSVTAVSRGTLQYALLDPINLSKDPDAPTDKNFNITWWCRKTAPTTPEVHQKGGDNNPIEYNAHEVPIPWDVYNSAGGGCFGKGPGTILVTGGKINLQMASFTHADAKYEVKVRVAKDTRVAFAAVELEVMTYPPPTVSIGCVDPKACVPYGDGLLINPSNRLALLGECLEGCVSNMTYKWEVFDEDGLPVNETDTCSVDVCGPVFITKKTVKDLAVGTRFFEINKNLGRFKLKLTMTTPAKVYGYSQTMIILNQAPMGGVCTISPTFGKALVDDFPTICDGWRDPESAGITSYVFYTYENKPTGLVKNTVAASALKSINIIFPVGYFEVRCEVWDTFKAYTDVLVGYVNITMPTEDEVISYNTSDKMQYLSAVGDQTTLAMVLKASSSIRENADWLSLDSESMGNLTELEQESRLRDITDMNKDSLMLALDTMNFATLSQLNVGAGIMESSVSGIFSTELAAYTVDMETRESALNLLDKMTNTLDSVSVASPYDLQPFLTASMNTMSALMTGLNKIIDNPEKVCPNDKDAAGDWDYEVDLGDDISMNVPVDRETQLKQNIYDTTRLRAKQQVDKMMSLVDKISDKVNEKCVVGETVKAKSESGASIVVSKLTEEVLWDGLLVDPGDEFNASVRFPKSFCPSRYNTPGTKCKEEFAMTVVVWPCITHVFPSSKELLTNRTKVISIDISVRTEKIDVKNESNPILLEVPRDPETLPEPLLVNTKDAMNAHLPIVYHAFNITKNFSAYTIDVFPEDTDLPLDMAIMIDFERLPTPSNYSSIHYVKDFIAGENGSRSHFVNSLENTNKMGRFFLGVVVLKSDVTLSSISVEKPLTKEALRSDVHFKYKLRVYTSGCYYFNSYIEQWVGDGLNVVSATPTITTCETWHLTPFGSGFFPTPNTIDFEYVFANTGFKDNLTLYLVLIITLVWYIIMSIWARFMDRKDIQHRGVIPLEDNQPQDKYLYELTFTTGPDKEAGTNSNIQFIVSGEYAETDVRSLPRSDGKRFHRYSVDSFVMSTRGPLGHISYIRVWHDNSGNTPFDGWQLQSVVIRDLQTRKTFPFRVNDWLALDRGKTTVDATFSPTESEDGKPFTEEFYMKAHRNANEDHIWMSMFLRPTGSRFSRVERVSVCAFFLYVSMLFNAVWYKSMEESPRDGLFNFGPITISTEQTIIGIFAALLIFPIVLLFVFIFKRARPYRLRKCRALEAFAKSRREALEEYGLPNNKDEGPISTYESDKVDSKNPSKEKSPVKCLPWWMRYLVWILILAGIGASVFLVWSYGVMWGEIKTAKWCSSFITSFFISLLMSQWVKVLIKTTIGAACCKKLDGLTEDIDCDEELPHLKIDEEWKHPKPLDPFVSRKVHRLGGVDSKEPEVAKLVGRLTKEREMSFVIRDIGAYCLFLILLFTMVNGRTDPNSFLLQSQLRNAFVKEGHPDLDFSTKIHTADDFWMWAKTVIMPELRAQRWYNNEPPYGLRGFLGDMSNRIMGYAILRQVRSHPSHCRVVKPMDMLVKQCSGTRGIFFEDTIDYCAHWKVNATFSGACEYPEFKFTSAADLQTFPQIGYLGTYGGGGYVLRLKGPQNDILDRLTELQKRNWIDKGTRAIILEFSVYNANVNLFATANVFAEFNEGGGIIPKYRFDPVGLLPKTGFSGTVVFLAEVTFVACTAIFTLRELWNMKKQKCQYFASYWNIAEVCILLTSYATIGVYVYKYLLTREAVDLFEQTYGNGYIRIDSAAILDQFYLYLIALICFFSTLKLIKLLQFNKRMDVLALTIRNCWDELSIFFIAFGIIFFAFCCLFYFMFLMHLQQFSTFIPAIETCFSMMLGKFNFEEMNNANPMSPILFFAFSVINSMILINIMLTIILKAFNDVKMDLEKRENKYDVIDFVWSSIRRAVRLDEKPSHTVSPNLVEKTEKTAKPQPTYGNTDELPDKVSQLMKYIGDTYFDGKVDLNDPRTAKNIMGGKMYSKPAPDRFSSNQPKRNVFSSD